MGSSIEIYANRNELSFCKIWCNVYKIAKDVNLFLNDIFDDDYFFNRIEAKTIDDDFEIILKSVDNIVTNKQRYYLHLYDGNSKSITKSRKFNFVDFGILNTMKLEVGHTTIKRNEKIKIVKISNDNLNDWVDVFCKSFNSTEFNRISDILLSSLDKLVLFLANIELYGTFLPVGCSLILEKNDVMGLYCLGTIPKYRNKGVAKELIRNASLFALSKGHALILQTLSNEGYEKMYSHMGFETIYKKNILSNFVINKTFFRNH